MFKIEPVRDKSRQKELCRLFSIEFYPDNFAYYMFDCDSLEPMGMSQFEINESGGVISHIKEIEGKEDFEAMFILGRSTMSFIESCGVTSCYALEKGSDARLLSAIGFKTDVGDGRLFCDLTGMFDGNCGNH